MPESKNPRGNNADRAKVGTVGKVIVSAYLILVGLLLVYLVVKLWPVELADASAMAQQDTGQVQSGQPPPASISILGVGFTVLADVRLILLVIVMGALGSYIHACKSFVTYVGNRELLKSWLWFYIMLPFVGMPLALIFYFVIRGGLLSGGAGDISPYGVAALAGLVGMFSDQATVKLKETFQAIFKVEDGRRDKLGVLAPEIETTDPATIETGSGPVTIKVTGHHFTADCVVTVNGQDRNTEFSSDRQLTADLTAGDTETDGSLTIRVRKPAGPTDLFSDPANISVAPQQSPPADGSGSSSQPVT